MNIVKNISRRQFALALLLFATSSPFEILQTASAVQAGSFTGSDKFKQIVDKAIANKWNELPINELMGHIAKELIDTPYVANTLDHGTTEQCTINLNGLDCVTFFESTLDLARMLKLHQTKPSDMIEQVSFTRYRGGNPGNYTTRLHYTSDWFYDNEKKGVVKILSDLPGAVPFEKKVSFMSTHPASYAQLVAHPEYVEKMKHIEEAINSRKLNYLPLDKIAGAESLMHTGDIVGICTDIDGLDITHTGLVIKDSDGVPHFTDALSKKSSMKVTFEPDAISKTMQFSKQNVGIMLARPLEPRK